MNVVIISYNIASRKQKTGIFQPSRDRINGKLKKVGIISSTSTEWLLVHCFWIELEFEKCCFFFGEIKTLGTRTKTNYKLDPLKSGELRKDNKRRSSTIHTQQNLKL